jgi:alpha-methylacyl-CoA racemase
VTASGWSAGCGRVALRPVAGLRTGEFVRIGSGPFAAMLLADRGADTLKIDRPGDPYSINVVNRERTTLYADLNAVSHRENVLKLLGGADALIEGFRPGVMERLELSSEPVLQANPKIAYGQMTGWGRTGPLSQTVGHDINYVSVTGPSPPFSQREHPSPSMNLVGDYAEGSLCFVSAILAAIIAARQTGFGQVVDMRAPA